MLARFTQGLGRRLVPCAALNAGTGFQQHALRLGYGQWWTGAATATAGAGAGATSGASSGTCRTCRTCRTCCTCFKRNHLAAQLATVAVFLPLLNALRMKAVGALKGHLWNVRVEAFEADCTLGFSNFRDGR